MASRSRLQARKQAAGEPEHEHEHEHGALTHSTRNVLFDPRQHMCCYYSQIASIRGITQGVCARLNGIHLQYAGKAPDVREAEQDAEDNRHCRESISISMSPSHSYHPSRCIDHQHIMRADRTYPMHPAHANDGSAQVLKQFVSPTPRNRALQNALCNVNAMQAGCF